MGITKYISELLYRYECVIVPNFGAFLTKRQPATLHESTNTFYPPKKLISFNSQLQNNDGLLANYIAAAENISYTDAVSKIKHYVASLHQEMTDGKQVVLESIGSFFTSVENTLQFEPADQVNFLTEAFGLSSFVSPAIKREIPIKREVYKEEVAALEDTTPIAFTPEKRRELPFIKYAAIAAVTIGIIGLSGYMGLQYHNGKVEVHNYTQRKQAAEDINTMIQEATFEISNPLPAINLTVLNTENATTESKYHIVAGAFRIQKNAARKVNQLKKEGFNAQRIGVNQYGLHQVIYDSYSDRTEALEALQSIKKEQDRRAWLLVKEL